MIAVNPDDAEAVDFVWIDLNCGQGHVGARVLKQHEDSGADVTLATIQIDPNEVYRFGVVGVDRDHHVTGFQEKPKQTELRSPFNPDKVSASMGIYLFNTDVL